MSISSVSAPERLCTDSDVDAYVAKLALKLKETLRAALEAGDGGIRLF